MAIRHALREMGTNLNSKLSGTVEVDETYIGGKRKYMGKCGTSGKVPVVSLLERGGRVRSRVMQHAKFKTVKTKSQKKPNDLYTDMGFDDIMRRVSKIKPSKPKKNAKRKK
jgi:hypothetical protein